jgi:transposase
MIRDLPCGGTPMILRLSTRRFFCDQLDCRQRIFAEQLPELAVRRARGTRRLCQTLIRVGLECGGEPGRRLGAQMGITTSGDTILRRLRTMPPGQAQAGRVIGVDDFAFRRGQRYGTLIIDHESGRVIDLLADRTGASLEAWLAARPLLPAVVTRDRSGVYAKAITAAAPDAVQVADRWHLLANSREAIVRLLDRHHPAIAKAMAVVRSGTCEPASTDSAINPPGPESSPPAENLPAEPPPLAWPSAAQQHSSERRAKRIARYQQVLELDRQGHGQRAIMRELKMGRRQVLKLLGAGRFPERAKRHHVKQVDHYTEQLRARWAEGVRNARELTRSIRTLGYTGGHDMVRRCVASWRTPMERMRLCGSKPRPRLPIPLRLQRPSSLRLSWLLVKDDMDLRPGESELIAELRKTSEPIRVGSELARSFGQVVRTRDLAALDAWIGSALGSGSPKEMSGFAEGLVRNWTEVKAAMELPWSNGRTEGHVNRLKLIKRKMYGRAKLDLLRIRATGSGP